MSGQTAQPSPGPYAWVALTLAGSGLSCCAVAFVLAPHDKLADPLVLALAVCVVAASFLSLDVEGSIFWGGAAIPHICAFALLGPAPAAVITAIEECSVWAVDRYRLRMFPINLLATLAPNMTAAQVMYVVSGSGLFYYLTLAFVACGAIALNFFLVTALVGLFYGEPIFERYVRHRRLAGPLAINLAVAIAAVALYRLSGIEATVFVAAGVLVFAYVIKRFALERDHLARISELAESRGELVAQLLEAEDRERRVLAEMLHDDVIQTLIVTRQDLVEHSGAKHEVRAVRQLDEAIASLRGAIRATHPSVLDRVGLATALTTVSELYSSHGGFRFEIEVANLEESAFDRLIFAAAREFLANAAKHAHAERVEVRVWTANGSVFVRVTDDGQGFDPKAVLSRLSDGHIGLPSLRARVEAVGGQLTILAASGCTNAEVRLPLCREAASRTEPVRKLTRVSED